MAQAGPGRSLFPTTSLEEIGPGEGEHKAQPSPGQIAQARISWSSCGVSVPLLSHAPPMQSHCSSGTASGLEAGQAPCVDRKLSADWAGRAKPRENPLRHTWLNISRPVSLLRQDPATLFAHHGATVARAAQALLELIGGGCRLKSEGSLGALASQKAPRAASMLKLV